MKKRIAILLALSLMLCLVACTPANTDNNPGNSQPSSKPVGNGNGPVQDSYSFTYNGVTIALNAPMSEILDALGSPKSFDETPSCAFEGMDRTYGYESIYIQTYTVDAIDYVYMVWFEDDLHSDAKTAEGIHIGSTKAELQAAYGNYDGSDTYTATMGGGQLSILLDEEDKVSSIQYAVIIN